MREVTLGQLIELLEEIIDVSGLKIDSNMVLGEDIPIDSAEMLRILSRIESRYKFRFRTREILSLKTLGDLIETIRCHINTSD